MPNSADTIDVMIAAALRAGDEIMQVYASDFDATQKGDGSPVTVADDRAEAVILEALAPFGLPVLAEESVAAGRIPDLGTTWFVVDPLDGTKEFIKRNGEFTVNIALIEEGRPVLGVVYAPALNRLFWGGPEGAFTADLVDGAPGPAISIAVDNAAPMRVVASRSHGHAALAPLCDSFKVVEDVSVGSSLKFCLVAEGRARLYPRFTPTCEWDTAAGQAVLEAAGGHVCALDGAPLHYGKSSEDFLNPYFVAAGDEELAQAAAAQMRALV